MPQWVYPLVIGSVVLALIGVIFGLLMQRLGGVEGLASEALLREDHERLCAERMERVERRLTELFALIKENERVAVDRRHLMYGRLDEICQRLAMLEAKPGDPRLPRRP